MGKELLEDETLTVAGATKFTGLSKSTLYEMMGRSKLVYTMAGGRRLIPKRALVRLLAENLKGPGVSEVVTN